MIRLVELSAVNKWVGFFEYFNVKYSSIVLPLNHIQPWSQVMFCKSTTLVVSFRTKFLSFVSMVEFPSSGTWVQISWRYFHLPFLFSNLKVAELYFHNWSTKNVEICPLLVKFNLVFLCYSFKNSLEDAIWLSHWRRLTERMPWAVNTNRNSKKIRKLMK